MAFAALGLDEAQQRTLEGAVRGLADQARHANAQRLRDLEQEVQMLRTQAGAPAPPHPSRGDPPDARLGKPTVFTGHEGKWDQWYFKARAYLMCMGGAYPAMIAAAEAPLDTDVSFSAMTPEEGSTARKLFLALVMLTEESALRLVQTVQDSNGVEALRRLLQRFNPITQGRVLATLNGILQADFGADEVGSTGSPSGTRRSKSLSRCRGSRSRTSSNGPSSPRELRLPYAPISWSTPRA